MKKLYFFLFLFFVSFIIKAQDTFSIIAVDPITGEVGSIGASCVTGASGQFDTWVTDIIPGKGGVNSQAYICIPNSNLQTAIAKMEEGLSPQEIIDWLLLNDNCSSQNYNPEYRQYGIVDLDGNGDPRAAGWTGNMADDYKEDRQGIDFSVQGNILLDVSVIDNMTANMNSTDGTLADKLMAGLQGANIPGADSRCLNNGTSSRAAWFVVYKADDEPGNPYLRIVVPTQAVGIEPIDVMQDLYDDFLAVEDFDLKSNLKLFPNPASEELMISYNSSITLKDIKVYDLKGKRIAQFQDFSSNNHQHTMDVSRLENGVYFLKIKSLQGTTTLRFIKN